MAINYIPRNLRDRELFQNIFDVISHLDEEERKKFQDVVLKYKDPFSISKDCALEVIAELGFSYLTDVVEVLSDEELGTLVSYIGFIGIMKGTRRGLEVVFDLLGLHHEIIEWWEYDKDRTKGQAIGDPVLDLFEWKLIVDVVKSPNLTNIFYTMPRVREFSRNYVYPLLSYVELVYKDVWQIQSFSVAGVEKEHLTGSSSTSYVKTFTAIGVQSITVKGGTQLEAPSLDYYNDTILAESNFFLYTEDGNLLKTEV